LERAAAADMLGGEGIGTGGERRRLPPRRSAAIAIAIAWLPSLLCSLSSLGGTNRRGEKWAASRGNIRPKKHLSSPLSLSTGVPLCCICNFLDQNLY
jgi:hypothetical protein